MKKTIQKYRILKFLSLLLIAILAFFGKLVSRLLYFHQHYLIYAGYRKKYEIDEGFRFGGMGICFYGNGRIVLGKNTYISDLGMVQSYDGCLVQIGSNCSISRNFNVYTYNYDANQIIRGNKQDKLSKQGDVIIGDNCWIGANVFIKENVRVGNNCVIGANSLVTRDIPDNSVVMGVPAKVVKYYHKETNETMKEV